MPFVFPPAQVASVIEPLTSALLRQYRPAQTYVLGIQGGQGTGKTTLARILAEQLRQHSLRVVQFSLDDFYTSLAERRALAMRYPQNPFYQIARGLPGTHRVSDLQQVLRDLRAGLPVELPIFDKSAAHGQGEIAPHRQVVGERQDFVVLEGWCVGLPLVSIADLQAIARKWGLPTLPSAEHLQVVLDFSAEYQLLWQKLDALLMLQPDQIAFHTRWRWQQEQTLLAERGAGMSAEQIAEFVARFLPFTCLCYEKLTPRWHISIDAAHTFYRLKELSPSDN